MQATQTMLERAAHLATRKGELSAAARYLTRKGVSVFGVEYVECAGKDIAYVNLGDTYTPSVIQEGDVFSVSSWGGWFEETENEHCEDEGEIRCGYCGEFTPCAKEWRDTVCDHCGRYVQNGELPPPVCEWCGERECDCEE